MAQIGVLVVICFMLNFLRLCRLCECLSSGCVAHAMCPVPYVLCVVLHFASCPIVLWSALLVVDTHVRTCDLAVAFCNILSGVRKPCYYFGLTAENKAMDEATFAEEYLKEEIRAQVLAEKLVLPHFKLDDASSANDEEEEIPLPSLTKLTWNQEQLIFPEAFTKRWSGHEKYGDSFTELVEKAEAVTASTFIIRGSPAKSNAGKRELESPSPAQVKRLKSETVYAEADVDVLPGGLLAKVPLKNHCSLQIFPGPRVFLVHDVAGDAPETFAAGKEVAGFYGSGAWWQKGGAKKDQQVTDVDMRFLLQDYSSMILHQGVYTSVGEVVDAKCLMVDKNCTIVVCVCLFKLTLSA